MQQSVSFGLLQKRYTEITKAARNITSTFAHAIKIIKGIRHSEEITKRNA